MTGPRILVLDIETGPIEARTWGMWKQNIDLKFIQDDWCILAYAAKWLGDDAVLYKDNRGRKDVRNDRVLLKHLHRLLDEADIVVTQNGIAFDIPKIMTRFITEGLPPVRNFQQVDTKVAAASLFKFTSNKLEFLTNTLTSSKKLMHNKYPGNTLWIECLAGNTDAWQEMEDYNRMDVVSTEELYLKLRPWIKGHPNIAAYYDDDELRCPRCGSTDIAESGIKQNKVLRYIEYLCNSCGGYAHSRTNCTSKTKRRGLLTC